MLDIDNYTLSYHITILPNIVIYSCITKATEYIHFDKDLALPTEHQNSYIDCFFNLYNKEGELMVSAHEQTLAFSLKAVINTVPLRMLKEFIKAYQDNSKV